MDSNSRFFPVNYMYSADKLKTAFGGLVKPEDTRLANRTANVKFALVTVSAYQAGSGGTPHLLRSYESRGTPASECLITDDGMATSSAPTYVEPALTQVSKNGPAQPLSVSYC